MHCFTEASSSIFPSSSTAPVPSPIAATTRRAWATSSGGGLNTRLAISICAGWRAPRADAAEQVGVAELVLAGQRVGDVSERPVDTAARRRARRRRPCGRSCSATGPADGWAAGRPGRQGRDPGARGSRGDRRPTRVVFIRRLAARSAGPRHRPCIRGDAAQMASTLATPRPSRGWRGRGSATSTGPRLELRQQPVDVVDVLRSLDLGDHHHIELVADLRDGGRDVVEHPRRVERVDPRPELGVRMVPRLADLDEAGTGVVLLRSRNGVLEVGEQHVDRRGDVRHLGDHLRVVRRQEVDHAGRAERDLADRLGAPIANGRKKSFGGRTSAG